MKKTQAPPDTLNRTRYPATKNIRYLLGATAEYMPSLLYSGAALVGMRTLLPILNIYLPRVAIAQILQQGPLARLLGSIAAFAAAIALLGGAQKFFDRFIWRRKNDMNLFFMRKITQKSLTTDYGNQMDATFRKLQNEAWSCCNGSMAALPQVCDVLVELLCGLLGLAVYGTLLSGLSPWILLFLLGTTVAGYLLNKRVVRWLEANGPARTVFHQRMDYINRISGQPQGAKDIRLYRMAQWFDSLYHADMRGLAAWHGTMTQKLLGVTAGDGALALLREGAAYLYLIYLVGAGRLQVADFVLYFGMIAGFSGWLSGIFSQLERLGQLNLRFNYYRSFLAYPERYRRDGGQLPAADGLPKAIELRGVSYRYPGAEADTIHKLDLTIAPGEHLAIVGLNGAGKTTLIKLLCGLLEADEGQVLYDGVDIKELDRTRYYTLFSAVFQQFSLLPVTLEEAVAEAPHTNADRVRVESCLRRAGLWDKVAGLAKGLDTQLGKGIYDEGVELSGGETQKLLLARALYRDAPILLLDEPTAALDPLAESEMYQNYDAISHNKTALFISHRLASTRFCDRVLLLENGAICEEGTHQSLLAQKGRYYELFEMQAKYYQQAPTAQTAAPKEENKP